MNPDDIRAALEIDFAAAFDSSALVYSMAMTDCTADDNQIRRIMEAHRVVRRVLSDANDVKLLLIPAFEELISKLREERDDALREHTSMTWALRRAEERAEAARHAADKPVIDKGAVYTTIGTLREALMDIEGGGHLSIGRINATIDMLTGKVPPVTSSHQIAEKLLDLNEKFRCEHSGKETAPYLREAAEILRGALR